MLVFAKSRKKREPVYVFQVAFLSPPPEKQEMTICRQPEPCFSGTMEQWCNFLESEKGKEQVASWRRSIIDGYYQEIVITQFKLQGHLVLPGSSQRTLRFV